MRTVWTSAFVALGMAIALPGQTLGVFDDASNVGGDAVAGAVAFDAAADQYRITAAGANIWGKRDELHLLWKRQSGDAVITTQVSWSASDGDAHKKGGPMLRAGLDADDAHASAMVHADGLISLQYRKEKGGETAEVKSAVKAPARVRLARHGDVISMEVARPGGSWQTAGALTVPLPETVYAGLAASSHDANDRQTAVFTNVEYEGIGVVDAKSRVVESTLEMVEIETGERTIVYRARQHFEAPNWTLDGKTLIYNGGGKIYRIPVAGGAPEHIPTGNVRVNNDHGLSPDGTRLVVSGSVGRGQSQIFTLPIGGSDDPKLVTPRMPSYWHGWSPDGKTLAYCASRDGEYDIYTIPVEGGAETRLTTEKGLDDGPEYTPDGRFIYFNSVRSGIMRIWRMGADGSNPEMVSQGAPSADWFAHPSPDSKWIAYISYDASVEGHPPNKDVVLKLAPLAGGPAKVLVTLFGGQGTMNVPNWSPDSKRFAFVSYRLVKP